MQHAFSVDTPRPRGIETRRKKYEKKLLSALFALAAVSGLAFAFSACAPQDELQPEGHTHEFADAWSADSENHWHAAVCGHDENDGLAAHVLENGVCTVCGYTVEGAAGLEYALSDDGSRYTVSGIGTATTADITVPSIHNDLPVEAIGESAFEGCTSLTGVTIGKGITSIGLSAFEECSSLESIRMPDDVTDIGERAFRNCGSLKDITVPDGVTHIGWDMFFGCASLESVVLPDNVAYIGNSAFGNCSSLTNINIPDSVTYVGRLAFSDCSSLEYNRYDNALYLGNENNPYAVLVKAADRDIADCKINGETIIICDHAFYDCAALTQINIPAGITYIADYTFSGCSSLETVYYAGGKEDFEKIDIGINNSNFETAEIIFDYLPQF